MVELRARTLLAALFSYFILIPSLHAQEQPSGPDTLLFTNGEKLAGRLVRSDGSSVTFNSVMLGEVTAAWSKVRELHSSQTFAVVPKHVRLSKKTELSDIRRGRIAVDDQEVEIRSDTTVETMPVKELGQLIEYSAFRSAVQNVGGFLDSWNGAITGGASLVAATQSSRTVTGAIHLVRSAPVESWLDARDRTIVNFSWTYGALTQPETPRLKTRIYHADFERDQYFSPRLYSFAQAAFDHNFSQGLDLQQNYGSGIGWTVIKTPKSVLDVKSSMSYVKQSFQEAPDDRNLFASTFAQSYSHTFGRGIVFREKLSASPAWNNLAAFTMAGDASISMPLYKRLTFTVSAQESFLNAPPVGFRKNSFQLTTGLTYAVQ